MITLQTTGHYELVQTKKHHTKILFLKDEAYAWVRFRNIGEILVVSRKDYPQECTLSKGEYRLYEVEDEPALNDTLHLELEIGADDWQGYLLITGLPNEERKRVRIIPTNEIITNNPLFNNRPELDLSLAQNR